MIPPIIKGLRRDELSHLYIIFYLETVAEDDVL